MKAMAQAQPAPAVAQQGIRQQVRQLVVPAIAHVSHLSGFVEELGGPSGINYHSHGKMVPFIDGLPLTYSKMGALNYSNGRM